MAYLKREDTIKINKKTYNVGDLIEELIKIPSLDMKMFFQTLGLSFPRQLRIDALREALDPYKEDKEHIKRLSDEMRYRIGWYANFSDAQLVNLLPQFNDGKLIKTYKIALWLHVFNYMVIKKVSETDMAKLISKAESFPKGTSENILAYNAQINPLFYDNKNEIDGLEPDIFRSVLYKSSTLVEIREIGLKYNVDVPRRLRKQQLAEIIKDVLKERGLYTDAEGEKIDAMSVIIMQRYAINNDIKASIELKKEEVIEYILKNANETKEAYFVPTNPGVYEMVLPEVVEEPVEEEPVVEEPVVEEVVVEEVVVVEPVKEEPKVQEPVEEIEMADISKEALEKILAEMDELKKEVETLSEEVEVLRNTEFPVVGELEVDDHRHEQVVVVQEPVKEEPKVEAVPPRERRASRVRPINIFPFQSRLTVEDQEVEELPSKGKKNKKDKKSKKEKKGYPLYPEIFIDDIIEGEEE